VRRGEGRKRRAKRFRQKEKRGSERDEKRGWLGPPANTVAPRRNLN